MAFVSDDKFLGYQPIELGGIGQIPFVQAGTNLVRSAHPH